MSDLKSCPFCASNNIELSMATSGKYYKVAYYCKTCNAYGPRVIYRPEEKVRYTIEKNLNKEENPTRQEAEALWNLRAYL